VARVGISDVAAAAGVSRATVSLVLNDADSRISEETRQRVRRVAAEIGYVPNSVARSLRTRRTRTIGLISDRIATTPFAGRMLAGAHDVAREQGFLVFLMNTDGDPAIERDAIAALSDHQVDRVIYACMWHREVTVPRKLPPSTVLLDCRPLSGSYPAVVPDDHAGGAAAVRELIAAGHRRIAYVDTTEADRPIAADLRHRGYLQVLAENGIEPDPRWHVAFETSAVGGRQATEALLDLPAEVRPTAVFFFNDRMAVGAYAAAHARGLAIGRDLSVFGYDDQQLVAAELDPPLSTIALPHYEMGRWAMEVALGVRDAPGDTYLMTCPVINRASVGPPPVTTSTSHRRRASQ
jgi:LacI family transcriptional regulator